MFQVGRVVIKLAGRDAGRKGIIVDVLDEEDGEHVEIFIE